MNFEKYTDRARGFVQSAQSLAVREGHRQLTPEHLLKAMLDDADGLAVGLIDRCGGLSREARSAVEASLASQPKNSGGDVLLAPGMARLLDQAEKIAQQAGDSFVTVERLLLALALDRESKAGQILLQAGVTAPNLNTTINDLRRGRTADTAAAESGLAALRKFTRDLTQQAREGKFDLYLGDSQDVLRVIQVLQRRTKNNPLLVGEPDVGTIAIVEELARRIVIDDVPVSLVDRQLRLLDVGALIGGAKNRGELVERLNGVLLEIKESDGNIILLIDEVDSILGGGRVESTMEISNLLRPALANGDLRCIGIISPAGYRTYFESDAALARHFQPIFIKEPTAEETISILRGLKERLERHHHVRIYDSAIVAAATLSSQYFPDRFLPGKAIDLLDDAASRLSMQIDSKPEQLDQIERDIFGLKIIREALTKEAHADSHAQLNDLEQQLATLQMRADDLTARWRFARAGLTETARIEAQLDRLRAELAAATRKGEYERAGQLTYALIPELEKQLKAIVSGGGADLLIEEGVTGHRVEWMIQQLREPKTEESPTSAKVFISYRRDDSAGYAGRIQDRLEREFGRDLVFMDVETIPLGVNFTEVLRGAVAKCDVLLAVIGPHWLEIRDGSGARRLDNPNDVLRIEVATALQRGIALIPVLLEDATIPKPEQLPKDLEELALRNGLAVRHVSFQKDMDALIKGLNAALNSAQAKKANDMRGAVR